MPSVSVEFPGSCGEAITKTFVLSTKIFVLLFEPGWSFLAGTSLKHFPGTQQNGKDKQEARSAAG
jgi:hypothetical protein